MDKEKLFSWEENPYLGDFVREFAKPYDPNNDDYNPSLYTEDIKSGKNDPIYNVHTYWTKVPPQGIAKLIQNFTSPGDIVIDPFCGSGMTGVAGLMTGRHTILIDLCPAATFIAKNYTTPIDPYDLKRAVREIEENVREEMEWLYETICRRCGGKAIINYTIWSDVYQCPICETRMGFWEVAVKDGKVLREWECPGCGYELNKLRAKLVGTEPVRVNYNCPRCGRREDEISRFDLRKLEEIEGREIPYWYPRNEFPQGQETQRLIRRGIRRVDQFFTRRNLWALARLWKEAEAYPSEIEDKLKFVITSILFGSSKKEIYRPKYQAVARGCISHNLYLPSTFPETNCLNFFLRKSSGICQAFSGLSFLSQVLISTQSATNLGQIPDSSIDYCFTDPPYGANINYSELNFVWEAWLGHFTKIEEEAVVNPVQKKGSEEYRELMERSFREIFRVLKPGRFISLIFHNSQTSVWNAIQSALQNAGFQIAFIGAFDKVQRTFNQVTTTRRAVGYDVLVHAYKPKLTNHIRRERKVDLEEILDWLEERLRILPIGKNEERTAGKLHSDFIRWCLSQEISLGSVEKVGIKDFDAFQGLLRDNFHDIDGYYFLPGQIPQPPQGSLFATIKDVASALNFLSELLKEPKSYSDIQPAFLQALGGRKLERSLEDLLDENFVFIEEEGKWRAPTEKELEEWGKIKRLKQVKKFESWWRRFKKGEEKRLPPEEIMVSGLREWWRAGRHWAMVEVKEMLERRGLWRDTPYKARELMTIAEGVIRRGNE